MQSSPTRSKPNLTAKRRPPRKRLKTNTSHSWTNFRPSLINRTTRRPISLRGKPSRRRKRSAPPTNRPAPLTKNCASAAPRPNGPSANWKSGSDGKPAPCSKSDSPYAIFLYDAERVGITATGEQDQNELYPNDSQPPGCAKTCLELFQEFKQDAQPFFATGFRDKMPMARFLKPFPCGLRICICGASARSSRLFGIGLRNSSSLCAPRYTANRLR